VGGGHGDGRITTISGPWTHHGSLRRESSKLEFKDEGMIMNLVEHNSKISLETQLHDPGTEVKSANKCEDSIGDIDDAHNNTHEDERETFDSVGKLQGIEDESGTTPVEHGEGAEEDQAERKPLLSPDSGQGIDEPPQKTTKTSRFREKLECPKCKKMLLKSHLKRHMKANHKYKRTFTCNLYGCMRGFPSKKKLEHHIVFDHEENIQVPDDKICPYCNADLKTVVDYKYHVQRDHHHHCDHCHLRFAAKHKLEEHMLSVHQLDIRVDKTCSQCGAVQRGLTDYYRHIGKEHTWICEVPDCQFRFASKQKLEEHALAAHSLDIKVDKTCQMCRQEIRSLSDFRTHILRDHRFPCPIPDCELRFACKPKLEEHAIAAHETDIKVDRTCPHCQNVIRGLTDYFRHVEKDHRFLCSLCPLKFAYKQKFEEHMLAIHGENVKVDKTCPLCQSSMRSLTDYRRHVGLEHRFQCICPLKFACRAKLEAHSIEAHGLDLKMEQVCPQCNLTIRSLADFTRHLATEHRFHCPQCSLKFTTRRGLEEHSLKEHGMVFTPSAQLHFCATCGLSFEQRGAWEAHLDLAHPIPCHLCTMMFTFHSKMVAHCQDVHSLQLPSKEEQLTCPLCRLFFPTMARMAQHQGGAAHLSTLSPLLPNHGQDGAAPGDGAQVCLQ